MTAPATQPFVIRPVEVGATDGGIVSTPRCTITVVTGTRTLHND
jgi:hypothetical protein